jgi:dTDP-glucose 4,6-dehydratase
MKILITGGLGFQGSSLVRSLLNKNYEVYILNTFSEISQKNISLFSLEKANIIWGSITDKNVVEKTIRNVDLVVHMAANIHVDESIREPFKYYEVNVFGTNNILESAKKFNVPFIHVSSCEVYGYQDKILDEMSALLPNSPYASSKAGADVMCRSYCKTYNMNGCIIRPSNVYGPGQRAGVRGAVIPIWASKILVNENLQIYGDGKQLREFIFIEDLVDFYGLVIDSILIEKKTYSGDIFNAGSGCEICMVDLANKMLDQAETRSEIKFAESRPGEVKRFLLSSNKAHDQFNFKTKNSIDNGLKKYFDWLKKIG